MFGIVQGICSLDEFKLQVYMEFSFFSRDSKLCKLGEMKYFSLQLWMYGILPNAVFAIHYQLWAYMQFCTDQNRIKSYVNQALVLVTQLTLF